MTEVHNLDRIPAEEEDCTCACVGECSDEGAQYSEYPACCHMFETSKSLEEKYEQVTISQFMTSAASFQKFEADESIPEHVKHEIDTGDAKPVHQ